MVWEWAAALAPVLASGRLVSASPVFLAFPTPIASPAALASLLLLTSAFVFLILSLPYGF